MLWLSIALVVLGGMAYDLTRRHLFKSIELEKVLKTERLIALEEDLEATEARLETQIKQLESRVGLLTSFRK